jgi:hypothetical protein
MRGRAPVMVEKMEVLITLRLVEVALLVVALSAVKFWKVDDEKAVMLPKFPKVEEATDAEKEVEDA